MARSAALGVCSREPDSAACMAARDDSSAECWDEVRSGSKSLIPRRGRLGVDLMVGKTVVSLDALGGEDVGGGGKVL